MISKFLTVLFLLSFLFFSACSFLGGGSEAGGNEPVARVFNKFLYKSDLEKMIGEQYKTEDSSNLSNYYVYEWVHRNLLVKKAELELPNSKEDIEQKIEDYRASLLLFLYEQKLLEQNQDTLVTEKDVADYYSEHQENFVLREHILKAQFVILKKGSPQLKDVRRWLKDGSESAIKELQSYCFQYAINFSLTPIWNTMEIFSQEIPIPEEEVKEVLMETSIYETSDAVNIYLVKIADYGLQGKLAPLDYKREEIRKIQVNKKRLQHIKQMKEEIYKEALNKNQYEVFN